MSLKNAMALLLSMTMLLALAGCGGSSTAETTEDAPTTTQTQTTQEDSDEPVEEETAETTLSPVLEMASKLNQENAEYFGLAGTNVTWFYSNNILVIRGTGDMSDFADGKAPWFTDENLSSRIFSIVVEDGVTSIGNHAFQTSAVCSVYLPDSITSIGSSAFHYCMDLEIIQLPNGVETIGDNAFHNCASLTELVLPDGLETIGDRTFDGCESLTGLIIPATATDVTKGVFDGFIIDEITLLGEYSEELLTETTYSIGGKGYTYLGISRDATIYYTSDTFDAVTDKTLYEDGTQMYNWVKIS